MGTSKDNGQKRLVVRGPKETVEFWADVIPALRGKFDPKHFAQEMMVTEIVATCALSDIDADPNGVRSQIRRRNAEAANLTEDSADHD